MNIQIPEKQTLLQLLQAMNNPEEFGEYTPKTRRTTCICEGCEEPRYRESSGKFKPRCKEHHWEFQRKKKKERIAARKKAKEDSIKLAL